MGIVPLLADGFDVAPIVSGVSAGLTDLSVSNISTLVAGGLAIAVPLFLTWWGIRYIVRKASGALKKGRL